jgi:hypothetical protein
VHPSEGVGITSGVLWVAALNITPSCCFGEKPCLAASASDDGGSLVRVCMCVVLGGVVLIVLFATGYGWWCVLLCVRVSLFGHCESACTRGYKAYCQLCWSLSSLRGCVWMRKAAHTCQQSTTGTTVV